MFWCCQWEVIVFGLGGIDVFIGVSDCLVVDYG